MHDILMMAIMLVVIGVPFAIGVLTLLSLFVIPPKEREEGEEGEENE